MTNITSRPSRRVRRTQYPWLAQVFVVIVALVYIVPVYILVNLSLKPASGSSEPLNPAVPPTFENFAAAWSEARLGPALINSAIVCLVSTTLIVLLASFAAYPLSRSFARWSRWTFGLFMLGLMIPFQMATVPLYTTFRDLGLLGTIPGLIFLNAGVQLPFAVFMYTTFLRNSDRDYEEAAVLDGCSDIRVWWHVVLPLARPVTGTIAILVAITTWNDFFTPLLFLNGRNTTVPIALYSFVGSYFSQWNLVFAGLIISAIPLLAVYLVMQRSVIQGFAGGLKG